MKAKTKFFDLDTELRLRDRAFSSLILRSITLSLTQHNNQLSEFCLTSRISPDLYRRLDTETLFNLKPVICSPLTGGEFQPELDFDLQLILKPELLPHLLSQVQNPEDIPNYFEQINAAAIEQGYSSDPLLQEENWYCLSVKQTQETGEVGYETLWKYIDLAALNDPETASDKVADGIVHFVKDAFEEDLATVTEEVTTNFFKDLTNDFAKGFSHLLDSEESDNLSLFSRVVQFFEEDDWSFLRLEGETGLRLAFEGENGRWNCYAKIREEQQQFIFYSICPVTIPEDKRLAAAEFITRANYGLLIGNFELDFDDGEIRYKTSIDVEGDTLSQNLIKHLVYTNVTTIDEYLPGIIAVVEGKLSPQEVIAQIENQ